MNHRFTQFGRDIVQQTTNCLSGNAISWSHQVDRSLICWHLFTVNWCILEFSYPHSSKIASLMDLGRFCWIRSTNFVDTTCVHHNSIIQCIIAVLLWNSMYHTVFKYVLHTFDIWHILYVFFFNIHLFKNVLF